MIDRMMCLSFFFKQKTMHIYIHRGKNRCRTTIVPADLICIASAQSTCRIYHLSHNTDMTPIVPGGDYPSVNVLRIIV